MKSILATFLCSVSFFAAEAQSPAQFTWGTADLNAPNDINPVYVQQSVAAFQNKALWGVIQNRKLISNQQFGDYRFTEYDTSGAAGSSAVVTGKLSVVAMESDPAGNWIVLGNYIDSLNFAGGSTFTKPLGGSDFCLFRLNSDDLSLEWVKPVGDDFFCATQCFTVTSSGIYLPVDSADGSAICRFDLATGNRTTLWHQQRTSSVTTIKVDSKENVYLAGTCAFNGIDFNGHLVSLPADFQYPQYIVRYKSDGSYDWSYFMADGTCFNRELTLADDNTLYYTGILNDTLTLGALHLHKPPSFGSFMVSQLDSSGNFSWARQLSDTSTSTVSLWHNHHAALSPDGSLQIYAQAEDQVDWGDNISTNATSYYGAVVHYTRNGHVTWAQPVTAGYIEPQAVAASGNSIWMTGNASSNTGIQFGQINIPLPQQSGDYYPFIGRLKVAPSVSALPEDPNRLSLMVVPNPAHDYLRIATASAPAFLKLQLRDNTGRLIMDKTAKSNENIFIGDLPPGFYIVQVEMNGCMKFEKLLVQ